MATLILSALYAFIGVVVAIAAARQQRLRHGGVAPHLAGLLWPFLLPSLLQEHAAPRRDSATPQLARLESAIQMLREAWERSESSWSGAPRERERLEAFIARLRATETRLSEIDSAMERATASLHERLARLHERSVAELNQGIVLIEELAAQLTLLRFASVGESAERTHLEGLLARVGALAEVTTAEV